jgi:hypothetical protein
MTAPRRGGDELFGTRVPGFRPILSTRFNYFRLQLCDEDRLIV